MAKLSLNNLTTLSTGSAVTLLNNNNDAIEAALENTLSLDGTSPNSMQSNLDMNSNRIQNLVIAVSDTEPVRLREFQDGMDDLELTVSTIASTTQGYLNSVTSLYDQFDDRYLGSKAADPTVDNDGNALVSGALYFNNVSSNMRVYNGTAWGAIVGNASGTGLDDFADVIITSATTGNVLRYNGTYWVNYPDSNYQPIDSDLTAIAALATTSYGRSFLTLADASAARTLAGVVIGTDVQAWDAELASIAGLVSAADRLPYFTGSGTASLATFSTYARTLVDDADATTARGTLGLVIGTDVQAYDADLTTWAGLTPSANAQSLVTAVDYAAMKVLLGLTIGTNVQAWDADLTIWAGLTPSVNAQSLVTAADYSAMRTLLSLVPGTNVQAWDADLSALAGLTSAADALPYFTGSGTAAVTTLTAAARTVLDDVTVGAMLTTLGGQPLDADLTALAGLTSAADALPYFTGVGTATVTTLTAAARTVLDDITVGAMLTTLGGQPLDSDLTTIAGLTATTDNFLQAKSSAWASRTVAQVKTDLGLTGTNSGDQTITLTGDATGSGTGSFATTIAANVVTNTKSAQMGTQTIKGRTTAGTGNPEDLTATQATAILNAAVGDSGSGGTKGLVPAPAAGDASANKFLKADATWATAGGNSFATIAVSGQSDVVADAVADTLTLVAGSNVTITTNAGTDAITINSTAIGGGAISSSDEGVLLTATTTSFNFVGGGVTATNVVGAVTVTVPAGDVVGPASATDKAVAVYDSTTGKLIKNSSVTVSTAGQINAIAGTTTDAPLLITTGTLNTTAQAGAMEYDGIQHFSHDASARGVVPAIQFMTLTSNYTLTTQTAAQKLFNTPANGRFNVKAGTTYKFKCWFALASMSVTSGSYGFAFTGTATLTSQAWTATASKQSANVGTPLSAMNSFQTAAATTLVTANTNSNGVAIIEGLVRINAAGTLIPSVSLGIAAAAIVQAGAYCELIPIGITNTVTSEGNVS